MGQKKFDFKRSIAWVPAIIFVAFIFALSSEDGEASYYTSMNVAREVTRKTDISEFLNGVIRVCAHCGEYFLLSILIGIAIRVNKIMGKLRFIYTVMLSGIVALLDEFYQIFVPGRYGDIRDLLVDITGAAIAATFAYLLTYGKYKNTLDYDVKKRDILGISIDNITFEEAVSRVIEMAENRNQEYIVTPNADHLMLLQKNDDFKKSYEDASLVVTDGSPIMWIAEAYGMPILEKIPGSDMLPRISEEAAKKKLSMFILGAKEGVGDKAADSLSKKYKGLKIAGTYSPKEGFEKDIDEIEKIFSLINKKQPDILVLALGSPKQEIFIHKYKDQMRFGVALPFGAAVDFEAGEVRRAPKWMRKAGLEWFYRFLQEPGRLFKRYFIDDMKIFWIAWKHRLDADKK